MHSDCDTRNTDIDNGNIMWINACDAIQCDECSILSTLKVQ